MTDDSAGPVIDRIAPTRRPNGASDGTQRWRDLLFVHWEVDTDDVRRLLPDGLEPDTFEGKSYVGLVPFLMQDVRPRWLPRPFAQTFLETNVRLYALRDGRPGVYFLSLEAASRSAVTAARLGWRLLYYFATMEMWKNGGRVQYRTRRERQPEARMEVTYHIGDSLGVSMPGTFSHFLLERYLLFVERRGTILTGQVAHEPYAAHRAVLERLDDTLVRHGGIHASGKPVSVLYSPGVDVEVFGITA